MNANVNDEKLSSVSENMYMPLTEKIINNEKTINTTNINAHVNVVHAPLIKLNKKCSTFRNKVSVFCRHCHPPQPKTKHAGECIGIQEREPEKKNPAE